MTMTTTETWKSMRELGFSGYEASTAGGIRSVDRVVSGRRLKGRVLTQRRSNRGYMLVDLTTDGGKQVTRTVHTLVLGTYDGLPKPGQESCHLNDIKSDNRWAPGETAEERKAAGGNLMYDTAAVNTAQAVENGMRPPPPLRPAKFCVRCEGPIEGNGKRCHECVELTGREAAALLWEGMSLAAAAKELGYPSPEGLHTLAVRYGGYGARPEPVPDAVGHSLLWRLLDRARRWLELGDGQSPAPRS